LALVALLGGLLAPARAEVVHMVCVMNGAQEPVATAALGAGEFIVDTDANTMTYTIRYGGLSSAESDAHIHGYADVGTPAGILHTLPGGPLKTGVWNFTETDQPEILAGRTYVNVHSATFSGGEIRGQIVHMVAVIDGAQEPTASTSKGTGFFVIDTAANTLKYHIIYDSGALLGAETVAHIHGFSLHGAGSGPVHTLPGANPKIGTWTYTEDQEPGILNGRTYVNIHTSAHTGGEIRGQIVRCISFLNAAQEVGTPASSGYGLAEISLDPAAETLGYHLTHYSLTSAETATHIHGFAPPGTNAGILQPLVAGNPKVGAWDYGAGPSGLLEETYINVHTSTNTTGEIRGQLDCFEGVVVPVELSDFMIE
jgi:hypothetical protein